jgi:hypothetical protein
MVILGITAKLAQTLAGDNSRLQRSAHWSTLDGVGLI